MKETILLDKKKSIGLIHKIYLIKLKNQRTYTASTKTKSEVRGGGKKPWRQKGTGNARAGSIRSPLWCGGGVSFGPKPRVVKKKANKKERKLAILSAFYLKENSFRVVENEKFEIKELLKTKNILKNLNINTSESTLIIVPKTNYFFWKSLKNFKNLKVTQADSLSLVDLLNFKEIILSNKSIEIINNTYGKHYL